MALSDDITLKNLRTYERPAGYKRLDNSYLILIGNLQIYFHLTYFVLEELNQESSKLSLSKGYSRNDD